MIRTRKQRGSEQAHVTAVLPRLFCGIDVGRAAMELQRSQS